MGTTTAYRYVTEPGELLAALAPQPGRRSANRVGKGVFDPGRHPPADRPFNSGQHKKHGMDVQAIADPSAGCCGPHQPCPAPPTTSARRVNTASSAPLPQPFPLPLAHYRERRSARGGQWVYE